MCIRDRQQTVQQHPVSENRQHPVRLVYTGSHTDADFEYNIFEMKKIVAYFKETYDELVHKVSWPTYSELTNSAVVVLYASLLIALVVFAMDFCFQNVMEKIIYPH